jgi:hypothetical protein
MRGGPWQIFHFVGHGGFDRNSDEGFIALADENGLSDALYATQLAMLLADHRSMRLVVLNTCEGARGGERDIFSSTSSILVRRGMAAVLAMQYAITDQAAIEFARGFYETLAEGWPVDAAVAEARKAVSLALPGSVEWATPVLHMSAPNGIIFDLSTDQPVAPADPERMVASVEAQTSDSIPVSQEQASGAALPVAPPRPLPTAEPLPTPAVRFRWNWLVGGLLFLLILATTVALARDLITLTPAWWIVWMCQYSHVMGPPMFTDAGPLTGRRWVNFW